MTLLKAYIYLFYPNPMACPYHTLDDPQLGHLIIVGGHSVQGSSGKISSRPVAAMFKAPSRHFNRSIFLPTHLLEVLVAIGIVAGDATANPLGLGPDNGGVVTDNLGAALEFQRP